MMDMRPSGQSRGVVSGYLTPDPRTPQRSPRVTGTGQRFSTRLSAYSGRGSAVVSMMTDNSGNISIVIEPGEPEVEVPVWANIRAVLMAKASFELFAMAYFTYLFFYRWTDPTTGRQVSEGLHHQVMTFIYGVLLIGGILSTGLEIFDPRPFMFFTSVSASACRGLVLMAWTFFAGLEFDWRVFGLGWLELAMAAASILAYLHDPEVAKRIVELFEGPEEAEGFEKRKGMSLMTIVRLVFTTFTLILCIIAGFLEGWWRNGDRLKEAGSIIGSPTLCAWFIVLCVMYLFVVFKSHQVDSLAAWYVTCTTALLRGFLLILWVNAFEKGITQEWYPYAISIISFTNIFVEMAALYGIVYSDEVIAMHVQDNAVATSIWLSLPQPHVFWNEHQAQMEEAQAVPAANPNL